jgi:two-component system, response regulator PdtaR
MGGPAKGKAMKRLLRICVAEDDDDVRRALKTMICCLGREVVCEAENGQGVVEAACKQDFDLVIADLEMPVMDGLTVAEEITRVKNVPVILLSGHSDILSVVEKNEPIALRLVKPVTLARLREAIEQVTRGDERLP